MMHLQELLVQNRSGTSSRLLLYIYYLMGLMNIRWMDIVLRYEGRLNPAPLAFTLVNSIPYDLFTYESTLRRYLSLPQTVLK